jgi:hypothetical protein
MWLSKWREKKAVNDIQGYEHSDLVERTNWHRLAWKTRDTESYLFVRS